MYEITVENIKCGGCANTISTKLLEQSEVEGVTVDIEAGIVRIQGSDTGREAIAARLAQLGYPETGSVEGLKAAAAKAKSFVSCAVGRLDSHDKD